MNGIRHAETIHFRDGRKEIRLNQSKFVGDTGKPHRTIHPRITSQYETRGVAILWKDQDRLGRYTISIRTISASRTANTPRADVV